MSTTTSHEDGMQALQAQLHDVEDKIGATTITWRQAASNPGRSARAAEALTVLERQRELLRQALDAAQGDMQRGQLLASAAVLRGQAAAVLRTLDQQLQQRAELGRLVGQAAADLATAVQRAMRQGYELRTAFGPGTPAARLAGTVAFDAQAARDFNSTNLHDYLDAALYKALGHELWPAAACSLLFDHITFDGVAQQVAKEGRVLRAQFGRTVEARLASMEAEAGQAPADAAV